MNEERTEAKWVWDENAIDWGVGAWVCSQCKTPNRNISDNPEIDPNIFSGSNFCPNCGSRCSSGEKITSLFSFYDQEEVHRNCTVQILTNSKTGAVSIGWWKNGEDDEESADV